MKLVFTVDAWRDYVALQADDMPAWSRIDSLIGECLRDPFRGSGKPEPLRKNLSGWWSRRVTREHRLVYRLRGAGEAQSLEILSCRYHY